MGYIAHDAVIATTYYGEGPDVASWRATLPPKWQRLVIGPVETVVNQHWSWVFLPDGSKEGWPDSMRGDDYRREFIELFQRKESDRWAADVVSVRFGGDYRHNGGATAKIETPDDDDGNGESQSLIDNGTIEAARITWPSGTQLTSEDIPTIKLDPLHGELRIRIEDTGARDAVAELRKEVAELRKMVEGRGSDMPENHFNDLCLIMAPTNPPQFCKLDNGHTGPHEWKAGR